FNLNKNFDPDPEKIELLNRSEITDALALEKTLDADQLRAWIEICEQHEHLQALEEEYDRLQGRSTSSTEVKKRRKSRGALPHREKVIRTAIRKALKGCVYAKYLDDEKLDTPETWQKNQDNPCPKRYVLAYADQDWRQQIYQERKRVKSRMTR